MKADPKDVDLVIFYIKDPAFDEKVELFRQFILRLNKTEEGCEMLEELVSNQDFASEFAKKSFPGLPVDVWLRHIKASGFMRTYLSYYFHPTDTTRKVLKEGIRRIQIAEIEDVHEKDELFSRMSAQSFKLVWSKNERDVDKNLQKLTEEQAAIILAEMKNFAVQIERYKSYYFVLTNVLKWVIEAILSRKSLPDDEQVAERIHVVGSERGILDPYLKWILNQITWSGSVKEPGLQEQVTHQDIDSEIAQIKDSVEDVSELGVLCESMRRDIDEFRSKCVFAKCLLSLLIHPSDSYYVPPIEEQVSYAVLWALSGFPMYEAKDDVKRRVLTDLGLDEISRTIVLVEKLGYKSEYNLASSEEEIQKFNNQSKKGKAEKELGKYIRPILRKAFPKSVDTYVDFSTALGENGVAIPQHVYLHAAYRGQEIEKFLELAKKLEFIVERSNNNYCWATLYIDISQFNGDRKRIKKLIKSKLRFSISETNVEPRA